MIYQLLPRLRSYMLHAAHFHISAICLNHLPVRFTAVLTFLDQALIEGTFTEFRSGFILFHYHFPVILLMLLLLYAHAV